MEQQKGQKIIFTIGHSNHPVEEFVSLLNSFGISMLVDVRNFPSSKRYPHFNKETLETLLSEKEIDYLHLKELGGRRKPVVDSVNTRWRNTAFRGYADYMETEDFKNSVLILEEIASKQPTAYMCAEAVWWSCHRALISDYLKVRDWKVMHIMSKGKATEHPFTSAARVVKNQLRYDDPELFQ
jgi:uncharacterized protein (DUF488 family)